MFEILLLLLCLLLITKPLASYLFAIYSGQLANQVDIIRRIEMGAERLTGLDFTTDMSWKRYACSALTLLVITSLTVYSLLLLQPYLPGGGAGKVVSPDLAFNITMSFLTGTNLQTYIPEAVLTDFTQNIALVSLQFFAPAIDMAIAVALFRSFSNTSETIGNLWQDMFRGLFFVLLPMAVLLAVFNMSQGAIQSFGMVSYETLAGDNQTILKGPAASMHAISQLATNGGSYYATNVAHPYIVPTALTGLVNLLFIVALPAAFIYLFGLFIYDKRQSYNLLAVVSVCLLFCCFIALDQEASLPPTIADLNIDSTMGNLEGKELRFGTNISAIWAVFATATTNGTTLAAYESYSPLTQLCLFLPMMLGEILLGGVGLGMVCMLGMVMIAVFMASLMIGRSPEYLRKKMSVFEIQLAVLLLAIPAIFVFVAISLAVYLPAGYTPMRSADILGYTQSLYAITSSAFNNGSNLGGIALNNAFYNTTLGIGIFINSLCGKLIACALAGSIASKPRMAQNIHSLQTHGFLFGVLLLIMILLSALSYLPVLMLGPISSYMEMAGG